MNRVPRLGSLVAAGVPIAVCAMPVVSAETTVIEIKENDTLSAIVSDAYPGYRNHNALMQLILERNPDAFIKNDINFLIVGKTLELPDADGLAAAIRAIPPSPVQRAPDPVQLEAKRKIKSLTRERDQLRQQLEELEADNEVLRKTVLRLEETSAQQNEQLKKLEEQIKVLEGMAENQADSGAVVSETARQLAESSEKLKQLQTRYDESVKDNQALQQQLAESSVNSALASEASELKKQLAELQSGNEKQDTTSAELQRQLDSLKQQSESLRADNEKVLAELSAVSAKLGASQSDAEALRAELDASRSQLEASQSEVASLRTELDASGENNIALKSEIDQIKAATEKEVTLTPSERPSSTWWPWLLALLLLPVAWLLGQRSRPAPVTTVSETKAGVKTIEVPATADPVVPEALTSEQLDQMEFAGIKPAITPDDPDVAIKLDMARAYLDLRDAEAANDVLQEVIREGGSRQQQEAKEILSFIA